jgi:hypothetical protein
VVHRCVGRLALRLRACLRLATAIVGGLLVLIAGIPFGGAAEAASGAGRAVVEIVTVPALPAVRFVFDGQTYRTDRNGVVRLSIAEGSRVHSIAITDAKIHESARDLAFVRWWRPGNHEQDFLKQMTGIRVHKNLRIRAAFRATYLVKYSFVDQARTQVSPGRVTRVEFSGDNGHTVSGNGGGTTRLVGIRPIVTADTILAKPVRYRVQRVDVDGSNVVQVNQQAFVPSQSPSVVVPLLLRTAHFSSHDLLFGGPVGRSVRLTYPDGRRGTVPLDTDGKATVENLARGGYSVSVDAAGYSFNRPLVLSRNQYVDLPVLTYLDVVVITGAVLVVVGILYAVRLVTRRVRSRAVPATT